MHESPISNNLQDESNAFVKFTKKQEISNSITANSSSADSDSENNNSKNNLRKINSKEQHNSSVHGSDADMDDNYEPEKAENGGKGGGNESNNRNHVNTDAAYTHAINTAIPGKKRNDNNSIVHDDGSEKKTDDVTASASKRKQSLDGYVVKSETKTNGSNTQSTDTATNDAVGVAAAPPPPIMKGTLSYDMDTRRHLIRGMWNYENSTTFPSQRFELVRNLGPEEEITKLPLDGEFHGSFSLVYYHTTSKGKRKERSKVIPESGVLVKFTKVDNSDTCTVEGTGTNQFGIFRLNGSAEPSRLEGDHTWNIILRKSYDMTAPPPTAAVVVTTSDTTKSNAITSSKSSKIVPTETNGEIVGPLPPPSQSYPHSVICLRGKVSKQETEALGVKEVVHKIVGFWSSGLNLILSDPENTLGQLNRFEYDHKSSAPSASFPVSGRYSGWFEVTNEDGSRTQINERDVVLKFRKNSEGYFNVEGKGSNVYGKYTISGSLTNDNTITIFRHFMPRKIKSLKAVTSAPPPINVPQEKRPSVAATAPLEFTLSLDDVKTSDDKSTGAVLEAIKLPAQGTYSAVSRGVLRVNEDGSHSCQGKWAVTREHFTNGQTSNFTFRLEAHHAAEASSAMAAMGESRQFPVDSNKYKGSFQLKKQGARYQTIVDQQVVMKFRQNLQGSFNVYGKGINAIGEFNLLGTMVMSGKTGGQVELYRMYPPEKLSSSKENTAPSVNTVEPPNPVVSLPTLPAPAVLPGPPPLGLQRRESTRLVKLPSKLEDDDPSAQLARAMEKCSQILRIIREKDVELGGFFSEPVDPVALGIPSYYQIIKEPMDLKTVHRKLESNEIKDAEEFARLVRLVFENAMTFNVDTTHSVHQAARVLLIQFNQKFRDVERIVYTIKRVAGTDEKGKKKSKDEKKRKNMDEPPKSLKTRRLEEAQTMAEENARAISAIYAAAPPVPTNSITRAEFTALFQMIQQIQNQVLQTYQALADLSPGDENDNVIVMGTTTANASTLASEVTSAAVTPVLPTGAVSAPEKKKGTKRKSDAVSEEQPQQPVVDESAPLSFEEQELLTDTINRLPPERLGGVIQIIRDSASVGADEDEIDLEIDQLDHRTQRKLLKHVLQFVKKPKTKSKKKAKTSIDTKQPSKKVTNKPDKAANSAPATAPAPSTNSNKKQTKTPTPKAKPAADSFFAFGSKGDSDSDSDDDDDGGGNNNVDKKTASPMIEENPSSPATKKSPPPPTPAAEFSFVDELSAFHDDNDDDDELDHDDLAAANWNIAATAVTQNNKSGNDGVEDDAWDAAKEEAAAAKIREAERKAREKKMQEEAEALKNLRLQEAAVRNAELKAQRAEEEANEAKLKEQQEKEAEEAKKRERERLRKERESVEQTVDLEATRDIMKQYEQSFLDKDLGSASPSSDYGF